MDEPRDCPDPACPHRARAAALARQVEGMREALATIARDLARCPVRPGGERCALPAGHHGGCEWARGD